MPNNYTVDEDDFYLMLGEKIRTFRKKKSLTQDNLADQCNLKRTSISNIEKGKQKPPLFGIVAICNALEIELSDLVPSVNEIFGNKITEVEYVDIGGKPTPVPKSMGNIVTKIQNDLQKSSYKKSS